MLDAMKLARVAAGGDVSEWTRVLKEEAPKMTSLERDTLLMFITENASLKWRWEKLILPRPFPKTEFELREPDRGLVLAYRVCMAKCWLIHLERKDDPDDIWTRVDAWTMLMRAGIIVNPLWPDEDTEDEDMEDLMEVLP